MGISCLFGSHKWDGCKCVRCGNTNHEWEHCRCKICLEQQDENHLFGGKCQCEICGKVKHEYASLKCAICESNVKGIKESFVKFAANVGSDKAIDNVFHCDFCGITKEDSDPFACKRCKAVMPNKEMTSYMLEVALVGGFILALSRSIMGNSDLMLLHKNYGDTHIILWIRLQNLLLHTILSVQNIYTKQNSGDGVKSLAKLCFEKIKVNKQDVEHRMWGYRGLNYFIESTWQNGKAASMEEIGDYITKAMNFTGTGISLDRKQAMEFLNNRKKYQQNSIKFDSIIDKLSNIFDYDALTAMDMIVPALPLCIPMVNIDKNSPKTMETKVSCSRRGCNARILQSTAEKTGGLCMPCYKKRRIPFFFLNL